MRLSSGEFRKILQQRFLSPEFTSILAEVAANEEANFAIEPPKKVYRAVKFRPETFPCYELGAFRDTVNLDNQTAQEVARYFGVYVHVLGHDEEELDDLAGKHAVAITEFFWRYPSLVPRDDSVATIRANSVDYAPAFPTTPNGAPFRKSVMVTLRIDTFDN